MNWQNGKNLSVKSFLRLVLYSDIFLYESMRRFTISLSVNDGLMAPSFDGTLHEEF